MQKSYLRIFGGIFYPEQNCSGIRFCPNSSGFLRNNYSDRIYLVWTVSYLVSFLWRWPTAIFVPTFMANWSYLIPPVSCHIWLNMIFFLNLSSKNQFKAITYECTWLWDSNSLIFDKSCMCQNSLKYANFERLQEDLKGASINDAFSLGERSSQVKGLFVEEARNRESSTVFNLGDETAHFSKLLNK